MILDSYVAWRQRFLDEHGRLKLAFEPPPLVASFLQSHAAAPGATIPVPKGPVETW